MRPITLQHLDNIPEPGLLEKVWCWLFFVPGVELLEQRRARRVCEEIEAELESRPSREVSAAWSNQGTGALFNEFLNRALIHWKCRRFIPEDSLYVVLFSPSHTEDSGIEAWSAFDEMGFDIEWDEVAVWVDQEDVTLGQALLRVSQKPRGLTGTSG